MKRKTKKLLISSAVLLTTACAILGTHTAINVSASEGQTLSQTTTPFDSFDMIYGAGVRYVNDNAMANGLRFGVALPKDTYEKMATDYTAYTNVTYGVLIAPEDILTEGKELTEANVFGSNSIYDWATWSEEDNKWVYDETSNKQRIINLTSTTLTADAYDNTLMSYYGAIINIKAETNGVNNLAREFRGVGYVKYTYNNQEHYKFVGDEDNVRSMAYVAQIAISKNHTNSSWLQTNYVDKVTSVQSDYTVEYYFENEEGEFVQDVAKTEIKTDKTIDDSVFVGASTFDGYELDEDNENNVLSGKVLANGKLVLKAYYKMEVPSFEGAYTDTNQYLVDMQGEDFDFLTWLGSKNGEAVTAINNSATSLQGELVWKANDVEVEDFSDLEGVYTVTALCNGTLVYEGSADFYNSDDGMVWADNANLNIEKVFLKAGTMTKEVAAANLPDGATQSQYYYVTDGADATKSLNFSVLGIHSKAYYEMWKDAGVTKLCFDVYYTTSYSGNAWFHMYGTNNQTIKPTTWTPWEVTLEALINGWSYLSNSASTFGIVAAAADNTYSYQMYVGNFRAAMDNTVTDNTLNLADTKSGFDLVAMLNNNDKSSYATNVSAALTSLNAALIVKVNGIVTTDFSALEGVCSVEATCKGITIYTGMVDFYNSNDGMVWIDNADMSTDNVYLKAERMTKSITTTDLPSNAVQSSYYYLTTGGLGGGTDHAPFNVSLQGVHSKAYYEMWLEKDNALTLYFDVYYTTDYSWDLAFYFYGTSNYNITKGSWETVSVSLASLINQWDSMDNSASDLGGIKMTTSQYRTCNMYIGNFRTAE